MCSGNVYTNIQNHRMIDIDKYTHNVTSYAFHVDRVPFYSMQL